MDPRRPDSAAGFPGTAHGQAGQGRRSRVDNGSFKYLCPVATDRTDPAPGDRALVPILDLAQDRFQILRYRFRAFAGILNLNHIQGHRVGEVSLCRHRVSETSGITSVLETHSV